MDNSTIDDTPQVTINARHRAPGIRANVTQRVILQKAYEQSNVLSSEQAKALAEETGLPPKWIQQWFSRQRSKERKNNASYLPRLKNSNPNGPSMMCSQQKSNSATFSAAIFSDSGSSAFATDNAKEITTTKLEYQDGSLASSVSGSTNLEESAISELPSVPASVPCAVAIQDSGTGRRKAPAGRKNRKALYAAHRLEHAPDPNAQTESTDSGGSRLLKQEEPTCGPNISDAAQSDMARPSSLPTPQDLCASTPSPPQIYRPGIFPPRRSPLVTSDNAIQSFGKENKTRYRPSRLSAVDVPMNESDVLLQEDSLSIPTSAVYSTARISTHKSVAPSGFQAQRHGTSPLMCCSRDAKSILITPKAQITKPVSSLKYLVPAAQNRAGPLAAPSGWPDLRGPDFMVESRFETFSVNSPEVSSFFPRDHEKRFMESGRQGFIAANPATVGRRTPFDPDHLEALDPSRAPLKHLTSILAEYRAEDGTYLSLLVGLQDPAKRKKIIGCLCNEELALNDPFSAAMGLVLLSRLGVL